MAIDLSKKGIASLKKKEPLHKPELEEGTMDIGKPKKKNGRPCKYDHAMPGWLRAKEYRMRKRAKEQGK